MKNNNLIKIESTEKLKNIHQEYISICRSVLLKFNNAENPPYVRIIYQNLFQRLYYGIKTTDILMVHFNNETNFNYSIALQLRASLLDCMIVGYLTQFIQDEGSFRKEVARLSVKVAQQSEEETQNEMSEGQLDKESLDKRIQNIKALLPDNFEPNKRFKLKKLKELHAKTLADESKQPELGWVKDSYALYRLFSIHEHFGQISKQFLSTDPEYHFGKFIQATIFILLASSYCVYILEGDQENQKKILSLLEKFEDIKPTITY